MNFIIWNHQCQNKGDRNVSDQTHNQWRDNSFRYWAAGILCLFTSGGNNVKTNKSVETSSSSCEYLQKTYKSFRPYRFKTYFVHLKRVLRTAKLTTVYAPSLLALLLSWMSWTFWTALGCHSGVQWHVNIDSKHNVLPLPWTLQFMLIIF